MEKEYYILLMVINMMENGKMIKWMEKVHFIGNGKMVKGINYYANGDGY